MRCVRLCAWAALALLVAAVPASASSPVAVTIGASRDGTLHDLQKVVDRFLGVGRIDVRRDYIGARVGDPDPWTWAAVPGKAMVLNLIDRKYAAGTIGWYREGAGMPRVDGVDDGRVFERWQLHGIPNTLRLPSSVRSFGFYVARDPGGVAIDGDNEAYTYFTNRKFNDLGPRGTGAIHAPWDGDVQMLVYDVSRWMGPDTWLVACEYSDSGDPLGTADGQSDNDYSDIVFTVEGVGVTPTLSTTFGRLKALFR